MASSQTFAPRVRRLRLTRPTRARSLQPVIELANGIGTGLKLSVVDELRAISNFFAPKPQTLFISRLIYSFRQPQQKSHTWTSLRRGASYLL